jgi:hypothetical protein
MGQVWSVLFLTEQGVDPDYTIHTDETVCLLCPHGFSTWARRGAQAVQVHGAGNEKRAYTVRVAVTMDGRRVPFVHRGAGGDGGARVGIRVGGVWSGSFS